jgi:hypothetical protein
MIGSHVLAGEVFEIVTVLLFADKILGVATFLMKLHHVLKRVAEQIPVGHNSVCRGYKKISGFGA